MRRLITLIVFACRRFFATHSSACWLCYNRAIILAQSWDIEWSFFGCLFTRIHTHSNNKARAFPAFEVGDLISLCFAIKSLSGALFIRRAARHFLHVTQTMDLYSSRIRPERLKNYQEHRNLKDFGAGLEESGRFSEIPSVFGGAADRELGEQMQKKHLSLNAVELLLKVVPSYLIWTCPPFSPKKTQLISTQTRTNYIVIYAPHMPISSAGYPFVGAQSHTTALSIYILFKKILRRARDYLF